MNVISMVEYNSAFFGLYEKMFLVLKQSLGEDKALDIFRQVMENGLKEAYDPMGFQKGNPQDFTRVLRERDETVGLRVEFPEISDNMIIYRFFTDPFPNLKGHVNHKRLDDTFMNFKIRYLLGNEWTYKTTKHIWEGDEFTEHVITKN